MFYDFQTTVAFVVTSVAILTSFFFLKKNYFRNKNDSTPIMKEVELKSDSIDKLDSTINFGDKILTNELNEKAKHRIVLKNVLSNLTPEERTSEREIKNKQMEEIFRLISEQKETFGINSIDEIQSQMKLYTY